MKCLTIFLLFIALLPDALAQNCQSPFFADLEQCKTERTLMGLCSYFENPDYLQSIPSQYHQKFLAQTALVPLSATSDLGKKILALFPNANLQKINQFMVDKKNTYVPAVAPARVFAEAHAKSAGPTTGQCQAEERGEDKASPYASYFNSKYRFWDEVNPHTIAPEGPPFAQETFRGQAHPVTIVGVGHLGQSAPNSQRAQKYWGEISGIIQDKKPSIVVIEGVPQSLGPNPCAIAIGALLVSAEEARTLSNEALMAAKIAMDKNINFQGGEISDLELETIFTDPALKANGVTTDISAEDYRQYVDFRCIASMRDPSLRDWQEKWRRCQRGPSQKTFADFEAWVREREGKNLSKISADEAYQLITPVRAEQSKSIAYINRLVSELRDGSLRQLLLAKAQEGPVLAFYGAGHLYQNQEILRLPAQ